MVNESLLRTDADASLLLKVVRAIVKSSCAPAPSGETTSPETSALSLASGGVLSLKWRVNSGGECGAPPGVGGRKARRQGCLGRRSSPGTWRFPRSLPPRAPLAPCFHPPETLL